MSPFPRRSRLFLLPPHLLSRCSPRSLRLLLACLTLAGCESGTSLLLSIEWPADLSVAQLRLWGSYGAKQLFDEVRPDLKKDPLTSPQTVRILLPDHTESLTLVVEGFALTTDSPIARWDGGPIAISRRERERHRIPLTVLKPMAVGTGLEAGKFHTCARTAAGRLSCWGKRGGHRKWLPFFD